MEEVEINRASFRDRSGFVFCQDGQLYRQINHSYRDDFEGYLKSGLYKALLDKGYIIPHKEVLLDNFHNRDAYKVIKPEYISYLTYPYEWCFSQLKDAALLTLDIQLLALDFGYVLKDASAYNVQFYSGKPILIDSLSFSRYEEGPWIAYRQFCQHFWAPLLVKVYADNRLGRLAELYIDGIPLDLASSILPMKTWLNMGALLHLHLHAKMQSRYSGSKSANNQRLERATSYINPVKLKALVTNLRRAVDKLDWGYVESEWTHYYKNTNYDDSAMQAKSELVIDYLKRFGKQISLLADLGANTGHFSRLASKFCNLVVSFDLDESAVEQNYLWAKHEEDEVILPIVQDLFNPSPAIGWSNSERLSLMERGPFEVVIALALIHHLAICNNVPLSKIIEFMYAIVSDWLIIEFVPKEDSQVQYLLSSREDVFHNYNEVGFEKALSGRFKILYKDYIPHSCRVIYCLEKEPRTNDCN